MWKTVTAAGLLAAASFAHAGTYTTDGTARWNIALPGVPAAFGPADPASGDQATDNWSHLPTLSQVSVSSAANGHLVLDGSIRSNQYLPTASATMQATWNAHVTNSGANPMPVTAVLTMKRVDNEEFTLPEILPRESELYSFSSEPNEIAYFELWTTMNGGYIGGTSLGGGKTAFDYGYLAPGASLDVGFSLTIMIQATAPWAKLCNPVTCDILRYGTATTESWIDANVALTATPPVPEPETYATMLAGLGVLAAVARRRRSLRAQ